MVFLTTGERIRVQKSVDHARQVMLVAAKRYPLDVGRRNELRKLCDKLTQVFAEVTARGLLVEEETQGGGIRQRKV